MSKKKAAAPYVIHIWKTKHKSQPYTVTIDPPGRAEPYKMKQRYSEPKAARRGALRALKAVTHGFKEPVNKVTAHLRFVWEAPDGKFIRFA